MFSSWCYLNAGVLCKSTTIAIKGSIWLKERNETEAVEDRRLGDIFSSSLDRDLLYSAGWVNLYKQFLNYIEDIYLLYTFNGPRLIKTTPNKWVPDRCKSIHGSTFWPTPHMSTWAIPFHQAPPTSHGASTPVTPTTTSFKPPTPKEWEHEEHCDYAISTSLNIIITTTSQPTQS